MQNENPTSLPACGCVVQAVLNTWHLTQYQRLNDQVHARLLASLSAALAASTAPPLSRGAGGGAAGGRSGGAAAAGAEAASAGSSAAAAAAAAAAARAAAAADTPTAVPLPRILVCAPSNAATDELLNRVLRERFTDVHGDKYTPTVVRVGSESAQLSAEAQQVRIRGRSVQL